MVSASPQNSSTSTTQQRVCMNVSALIIAHERPAHLRACLRALTFQTCPVAQVVVVDDGSAPEAAALIQKAVTSSGLPIELVRRVRTTYCPAAARNEAARHALHDYLLFLDCDIAIFPDVIERHIAASRADTFQIGNCGLLDHTYTQPFLDNTDWNAITLQQAWTHADLQSLNKAARRFHWHSLQRKWGLARRHKPKLLSGHFSLHREDFFRINGFDEAYVGWGYEDDDLGMRLYMAGLRPHSLITSARALHLFHPSAKPLETDGTRPCRAYFRRKQVDIRCVRGVLLP